MFLQLPEITLHKNNKDNIKNLLEFLKDFFADNLNFY